jgi:glutamate-1-semialdehyde 2,1-aminomutase
MVFSLPVSEQLFAAAQEVIPGGVNSPVRAYRQVNLTPPFIDRGEGAYLYDVDGHAYLDYVCSWGPLILGHRPPEVVQALAACLASGTSFGAPTARETEMAQFITTAMPAVAMVRLVNSGTEATMSALRLARGYTGRPKIVKFEGCYHGHVDYLLIKAGSGALTLGVPTSPGILPEAAAQTLVVPYNDPEALAAVFARVGEEIAAVIIEPVAGNMGCIPPLPGYLRFVRELTHQYGSLLIFDEVMTGFRVAFGGAQALYEIEPDLTCLGKIIGGGLPVGAYGGKRKIMQLLAPAGPVYQAGTLSGNPLAVTAGLATLKALQQADVYHRLELKAAFLADGLSRAAAAAEVPVTCNRVGSMLSLFFTSGPVTNYAQASASGTVAFGIFFREMLTRGIYLAPSPYETMFVSLAHTEADLNRTIAAAAHAFAAIKAEK